jgi:hypothetical protein
MIESDNKLTLDLDRNRIRTVLSETYRICQDYLGVDFNVSAEEFVSMIDPYLDSNRVSIPVTLNLASRKYPTMRIEVNLRRKKVFARLHPPSTQATLNHMLKAL